MLLVVAADLARRRRFVGRLRDGLRAALDLELRTERRVDALLEAAVEVPRLQVFEDMREVHVRAAAEVGTRAEIDEPERLEVDDPRRAERVLLCRGEPEEELGAVRDQ